MGVWKFPCAWCFFFFWSFPVMLDLLNKWLIFSFWTTCLVIEFNCNWAQTCYWWWKFNCSFSWLWVCYCCYSLTLLAELHYGGFYTLISVTKCQVRETGSSVWETECMIRAELFLSEKDQWHNLAAHMEYIFKEMHRSAELAGVRKMDCQCWCQEKKDHSCPWAPTTGHATTFEQIGSSNNHQLIKSWVEEVYQSCLRIWQCQLIARKLRSLSDTVKDKLRACIWACWSAHAGSSSLEAVGPSVRSSARSPSKTECLAMHSAS